eukprot:138055_1
MTQTMLLVQQTLTYLYTSLGDDTNDAVGPTNTDLFNGIGQWSVKGTTMGSNTDPNLIIIACTTNPNPTPTPTNNPTTFNPTTFNPTTNNPTTFNPTTNNPTTTNPTTNNPTTNNPTT